MLGYCQLDPSEQILMKFQSKYKTFHSRKCILKCRLQNGGHLIQGGRVKFDLYMLTDEGIPLRLL